METGKLINKTAHRLRRRSQLVQKSPGISETQGRAPNHILVESEKRGVHPRELEEELGPRSSTVAGILSGLEAGGMIRREPGRGDAAAARAHEPAAAHRAGQRRQKGSLSRAKGPEKAKAQKAVGESNRRRPFALGEAYTIGSNRD